MPPLLDAFTDWECPNCPAAERTPPLPPNASRYHACPGLHGLNAPLVRAGSGCRVTAVERQDYLGREIQATGNDGKPYMAVRTDYSDGRNDLLVNAGAAVFRGFSERPEKHLSAGPGGEVAVGVSAHAGG